MDERDARWWRSTSPPWVAARVALLIVILGSTMGACSIMFFERSLIFFPSREGRWEISERPQAGAAARVEDAFFVTGDGLRLHGWYVGSPAAPARRVLLYFHGNAGNLSDRYEFVRDLLRLRVDVFIIDYRGYGKSEGTPTEEGLYKDAEAAWQYLTAERGRDPSEIILFGKSLGGAPAIYLAEKVAAAGLIAQSTFTSVPDVAGYHFPIVPKFLISTKMASVKRIGNVRMPKLIVHSPADEVIPYELGRRLYEAAPEPKRFLEVPGAGHNVTAMVGGAMYWAAMREFVESL